MSNQCMSYTHSLIFSIDGNRSQGEYIYFLLEGQSTEEYSANH